MNQQQTIPMYILMRLDNPVMLVCFDIVVVWQGVMVTVLYQLCYCEPNGYKISKRIIKPGAHQPSARACLVS